MDSDPLLRTLRYRWLIFWILAVGYVLVYFHRQCCAVLAVDMMRDLTAGATLTGFLAAAYFYPYAVMQLPAGLLSDSWGPRKTIAIFFVLAVVGCLVLGAAPTAGFALAGRTLVGIGIAMLFVPTMKVLAEWFHAREFATMTGILVAMGGVGTLSAAKPLAWLSDAVGWRFSFVAVGAVTLLIAALVWWLVRDRPAHLGWPSPAEHRQANASPIGLWQGVGMVFSSRAFWPIALWFFFDCAIFFSFGALWGGPYLMHVYGMTKTQAGGVLNMIAAGMIVGSPLLSYVSNNLFKGRKPVIVLSSAAVVALTVPLAFSTAEISLTGLYFLCFGIGIFANAIVVIGFTTTKELFPLQIAGTATGLVNLFPFAGGAVFQPILGAILERSEHPGDIFPAAAYAQAFCVLFGCSIVALLSSIFLKETMVLRAQERPPE